MTYDPFNPDPAPAPSTSSGPKEDFTEEFILLPAPPDQEVHFLGRSAEGQNRLKQLLGTKDTFAK